MEVQYIILFILYYFMIFSSIFWLLVYYKYRKNMKDPKPKRFPKVSIIIPVWNGEDVIERAIESCLELNYPKKEIIVVNDGSTDNTRKVCEKYAEKGLIKLINKENGGKASALNVGLKHATGELVACLDADSYFTKDALLYMVGYFEDEKVAAVTPAMKVISDKTIWQKIQLIEYLFSIYLRKLFAILGCQYVTPGPGSVYRKEVLVKLGGFDEGNITEDMEIAFRIRSRGYKIENSKNAITYTEAPAKLKELIKQRTRWYAGYLENVAKYKTMLFNPEYGILGLFLLPTNFIWIFALFYIFFLFFKDLARSVFDQISWLYSINFDVWPYIRNAEFRFEPLYWTNPLFGFGLLFTLLSMLIIYLSYRMSGEKIERKYVPHFVAYFFVYFSLMSLFYLFAIIYKAVRRGGTRWRGEEM